MSSDKDRSTQYDEGSLTLSGTVMLGTGVMIGAGIFALTGQMAEMAGALFPLAFLAVAKHELIEIVRTTKGRVPDVDPLLEKAQVGKLLPITRGRRQIEEDILAAAAVKLSEFGIELLDVRFKRINYNESVRQKIYARMISERQQIAERFRSEGAGEAAKIIGNKEKILQGIESEAYRKIQIIQGVADAKATEIYSSAYNRSPESRELYNFVKTLETYKQVIDPSTTLVLTTDSEIYQLLNGVEK